MMNCVPNTTIDYKSGYSIKSNMSPGRRTGIGTEVELQRY
jgi:hypothetical protein